MKSIARHYAVEGLLEAILQALQSQGHNLDQLKPEDLAPIDAFHIRGREASEELGQKAELKPGTQTLDLGCGLGGSARFLASHYGCQVTGIDLTPEYVELAQALSNRVGLEGKIKFVQGSALDLPFENETFDAVWTEHAQMNIPDKNQFYSEMKRVLKPEGKFIFHDIFLGPSGEPNFPVPWAEVAELSFLMPPYELKDWLEGHHFELKQWQDNTQRSLKWLKHKMAENEESGPPALGIHMLMRQTAPNKMANVLRNLEEQRIAVHQGVAVKQAV